MARLLHIQGSGNCREKGEGKKKKKSTISIFFSLFQYNDNNKSHNTKVLRVNFPLHKVDEMAEGFMEICQGLGFELFPATQKWKTKKKASVHKRVFEEEEEEEKKMK